MHHCAGVAVQAGAESKAWFSAAQGKCPYASVMPAVSHHETYAAGVRFFAMDALRTQAAAVEQSESMLRISRGRTRQKRGPPAPVAA